MCWHTATSALEARYNMNPNKQQKQRTGVSAPSAEGERSEKVPVGKAVAQLLAAELAPTLLAAGLEREKALERENKELRVTLGAERKDYEALKARAELLASDNRTMAKGVAIIVKENNELRTQVKKAEAKLAGYERKKKLPYGGLPEDENEKDG